ncbi:hypothetical protein [Nocardioides jejuensis]|uniref:Uncharacterized protein n=1 Tax=Nocardioides jejuensis TaxID=2502782 RepID=A0A4V2NXX6_9ACTN|nr:hypothetical protein [Nocardioides jejuensis]TCJ23012.1 hypothetical protein EPD65_11665 [Nocardioides jejuensis]
MSALRKVEEHPALRVLVASACQYEAVAIATGLLPTITHVHRLHPAVGWTIVAALAWHFRPQP